MIKWIKQIGICTDNSIQNADKGFDSKALRRAIRRRKMIPNRKTKKRGRKRFFIQDVYNKSFVIERCFAWIDSFKTLLVRFDKLDIYWLNWHFLACALVVLKV